MLHVSGQSLPPAAMVRESTPFVPVRAEDRGWQDLRRNNLGRDLNYDQWRKHVDLSYYLYRTNPLAHRIIEMDISFILSSDITFQSTSPETREILKNFWTNRYNDWPTNIYRRLRDLLIGGEWLHVPVVSKTGDVYINTMQSTMVQDCVVSPFNHEIVDRVIIKWMEDNHYVEKAIPIIRPWFNESTEELDGYVGEAFFFGINKTTDATRGIGELYTLIDGLDIFEEMIFNRAEKVAQSAKVWWDLELEGYNQGQIDAFLAQETDRLPPRSGTIWGHNEKATLEAKFPQTQADDHAEDVKVQKSHLVSSAGFPGTWYDEPGSAGRAVGAEMSEPTFKNIAAFQSQIAGFIRQETNFALDAAMRKKKIAEDEIDWEYTISFGSPNARDIQRIGPAMFRLVQAASQAIQSKIMTQEQAAAMLASQVNQLGLSAMPMRIDDMFKDKNFARQVDNAIADQQMKLLSKRGPGQVEDPATAQDKNPPKPPASPQSPAR